MGDGLFEVLSDKGEQLYLGESPAEALRAVKTSKRVVYAIDYSLGKNGSGVKLSITPFIGGGMGTAVRMNLTGKRIAALSEALATASDFEKTLLERLKE